MNTRVARALHRTGRVALSVTAVVGVVCALLTVLALVTGVRPLIFRSGSMGPDVPAGSLGFSRSTSGSEIKVGDVVTVPTKTGQRVTHRVVTVTHHNASATLQLKGDANKTADEDLYVVSSAPLLLFSVPQAGYVVNWFSHAPGSYVLALYVALMLVLIARRKDAGTRAGTPAALTPARGYLRPPVFSGEGLLRPGAHRAPARVAEPRGRGPRRALVVGAVVAVVSVALAGFSQSTWASWTDSATVSGSTITTGTFGDTTAPTVTMTYPNPGDSINNGQWNNNNCVPGICGTAADNVGGSGLAAGGALYELRKTSVGPNVCYSWNGTALVVATCGVYQTAVGTQASWRIPVTLAGITTGTYELRVKVTDVAGNTNRPGATPGGAANTTFTR